MRLVDKTCLVRREPESFALTRDPEGRMRLSRGGNKAQHQRKSYQKSFGPSAARKLHFTALLQAAKALPWKRDPAIAPLLTPKENIFERKKSSRTTREAETLSDTLPETYSTTPLSV